MKKYMVFAAVLCLCLFISACTSHGDRESAESGQRLITTPVTGWPENDYTREIVQPACGTPDYTVTDGSGSFFAVFLKDVTRRQGEQYVTCLLYTSCAASHGPHHKAQNGSKSPTC